MRVKTKTAVTINTDMNNSVSSILYMDINSYSYENNFETLKVAGFYYYENAGEKVSVRSFTDKTFTVAEVNAMYAALTEPTFVDKVSFDKEVAYLAGIQVMATEYGYNTADLEIEA